MEKYQKYLTIKHSWQKINCLTLIEMLYSDFLNKSFSSLWDRLKRPDGTDGVSRRWVVKYTVWDAEREVKNWERIDLTNLQEYDILVFSNRKGKRLAHFGMYIEANQFIHIQEGCYASISDLDEDYRNILIGAYRVKDDNLV